MSSLDDVLFAGAGIKPGVVYGSSDKTGAWPASNPVGPEAIVNIHTTGTQQEQTVVARADGDFLVVWRSGSSGGRHGLDGDGSGISARFYDGDTGLALTSPFVVNSYTTGSQYRPSAARAGNEFIVTWTSRRV